jgi:hypothetical protein
MLQDLTKKWSDVRQLVPQRDQTLQAELRKQQSILVLSVLQSKLFLCEVIMLKIVTSAVVAFSLLIYYTIKNCLSGI